MDINATHLTALKVMMLVIIVLDVFALSPIKKVNLIKISNSRTRKQRAKQENQQLKLKPTAAQ